MGNKVLRERLRGPSVAAYYPRRIVTLKDLTEAYPDTITWDEKEQDRLDSVQLTQSRGKGPPKKKRTAADSKQFQKKRKEAPAKKVPTF
ncbi:MAG: mitochondral 37S ribosomal protein S27 [Caeruleum heppii]|nr:MAG: mitochondral 37S ribosomal protein S27 [Caeruleum heppii]